MTLLGEGYVWNIKQFQPKETRALLRGIKKWNYYNTLKRNNLFVTFYDSN